MPKIELYAKDWCPYCKAAKALLAKRGLKYVHHNVTAGGPLEDEMRTRASRTSVPQVFIDGHHVGGFDDLAAADRSGELDTLLAGDAVSRVAALG